MYERQVYVAIHRDLSVVGNCKGGGLKGSRRKHRRVSSESSGESIDHLGWGALRKEFANENLELELAKFFNPKG